MGFFRTVKDIWNTVKSGLYWLLWTWPVWGTPVKAKYEKELSVEKVVEIFQRHFEGKYETYRPQNHCDLSVVFISEPIWNMDCAIRKNGWQGIRVLFSRDIAKGEIRFGLHHYISFAQERILAGLNIVPQSIRRLSKRITSFADVPKPDKLLPQVSWTILYALALPIKILFVLLGWVAFMVPFVLFLPVFVLLLGISYLIFIFDSQFKAMRDEVRSFIETTPEFQSAE